MSKLSEKIEEDLKIALRKKNEVVVSTLRMLKTALHNKEIELRPKKEELTDELVLEVLAKEVKKRKDSIAAFEKGGRDDLASKEKKELALLKRYLPEELSDDKIKEVVDKVIKELGASGMADFGKVMGAVMGEVKGRAGGDKVSQIVKEQLTQLNN